MTSNVLSDIVREIEELRRRMENIIRPAEVAEIRHSDGMVKIRASEWTSDWLPWTELSGGIKTRSMPTVGQEVVGVFPSGELAAGFVMPGQFTDTNTAPDAPNGESVMTRGKVRRVVTDTSDVQTVGQTRSQQEEQQARIRHDDSLARVYVNDKVVAMRFGDKVWLYANKDGVFSSHPVTVLGPPKEIS